MFCNKGVLRNFAKITGKHLCLRLFFNKVAGLQLYFKEGSLAQVFSCEFCEISKNTFRCLDQTGHTHFWPCPPKNFWLTFNLYKFVSKCKKSGYFIDLFERYDWLKNSAIRLAEGVLAHISRTKTFPNMWFVLEHRK